MNKSDEYRNSVMRIISPAQTVNILICILGAMLFKKDNKVPDEIKKVNLESWYKGLDDAWKMKLSRYVAGADVSSQIGFFTSLVDKAIADENSKFAVDLCNAVYENIEMNDLQKFKVNERLIEAYFASERYEDVKAACEVNFNLFPAVKEQLSAENGGTVPDKLYFRNRYIDVIVGIDSSYDLAFEMLEKYNEMGILSDEDLHYRKESLKTHRLQRIFDGVYTYRPVGEK